MLRSSDKEPDIGHRLEDSTLQYANSTFGYAPSNQYGS
jgi:hypothetical protein